MERNNKKYVLFDAFVFGFKNSLAYIRPIFLGLLAIAIGSFLVLSAAIFLGIGGAQFVHMFDLFRLMPGLMVSMALSFEGLLLISLILIILSLPIMMLDNYGLLIDANKMNQKVTFPSFGKIIKIVIASLIRVIVGLLGLLLLVVPGILWFIRTAFINYTILDDNVGVFESFGRSLKITKGHGWHILAYMIGSIIIAKIGLWALLPVSSFAGAYFYRALKK